MPLPRRFSVRWLMGLVAGVALVFGLAIELQIRRERDLAAATETENRQLAAWHRAQIIVCDQAIAHGDAYRSKQRIFLLDRSARQSGVPMDFSYTEDWRGERQYHDYRAGIFETEAATWAAKREAAQRRLLLPF